MMTTEKIKKLTEELENLCRDSEEKQKWFKAVIKKGTAMPSEEEELEYLEGQLQALRNSDKAEPQEPKKVRSNLWPTISLVFFLVVIIIALVVAVLNLFSPKKEGLNSNASSATISQTIPKEEFKIVDYVVSANEIKPNPEMKNQQHKVFANGSSENSLSNDKDVAIKEMTDYMAHNVSALKEKAMTFNIVDQNFDEKKWLEKRNGSLYYNKEGQDAFYQVKAFLSRSKITSKVMDQGSNYYTTGLNKDNKVVVSQGSQDLSGQHYIEVRNPESSKDKYCYIVLAYCGNTVMKNNSIPGIPTENIEIPKPQKPKDPGKPGKPSEPDKPGKPSEPKNEQAKKPELDPANQGKAPVGGGQNDGSENGSETPKASLPEKYVAPKAPSSQSSSSSATTPSQDSRISEPSQWSGAGSVTDSNGTTKVTDNGAVTTPDGRNYSGLTNPSSVPPVESGVNGTTVPSSSANFAGNGSMSEPAIED